MTITTVRPGNEILLDAATAPARAAMHTSRIAARNLRHCSTFLTTVGGLVYRAIGSARQRREVVDSKVVTVVDIDVIDSDGEDWMMTFGLNEAVYGVVGAI